MKLIKNLLLLTFLTASLYSQTVNITNTLGTGGIFTLKDNTNTYLTLSQSTGYLSLYRCLLMSDSANSTKGVIYKGVDRFLHNNGVLSTYLGVNSGNLSNYRRDNTAVGVGSLNAFYALDRNSAFGYQSLGWSTLSGDNSAFGGFALCRTSGAALGNTAFGSFSQYFNTTGICNTSFGFKSLYNNDSGNYNSAFGIYSLYTNTTGDANSAFGYYSLFSNRTGSNNSAFGYYSLQKNVGNGNSAFGYFSLFNNTTGKSNDAFGVESLFNCNGESNSAFGIFSLDNNTSGNYNTSLGYLAGTNITTGSFNIAIGNDAQVPSGTSSYQVRIGNTAITYAGIQVPWSVTSDRKVKYDIHNTALGLNFITNINPVSYTRISDEVQKTEYGFIAQEVDEILKKHGVDNSGMVTVTDDSMYELRYNDLLAPMVRALQELKEENSKLKSRIDALRKLNEKIEILEHMINELHSKELKKVKPEDNK